jgi:AraC-like DNA-binding protein
MKYFSGIQWLVHDRAPRCDAWLEDWRSDCYALNFARSGRVRWADAAGTLLTLTAPVAWWTWPDERFTYGRVAREAWDHAYVTFKGHRVSQWIQGKLFSLDRQNAWVSLTEPERFAAEFDELLRRLDNPLPRGGWEIHLLERLLLRCAGEREFRIPESPSDAWIARLRQRITQSPGHLFDWQMEAERAGLSLVHMRRLFRERVGRAPHQLLIDARMAAAAHRLRTTREPIKQVAAAVGYENVYYFSKLFRERQGLPPGAYRRRAWILSQGRNAAPQEVSAGPE